MLQASKSSYHYKSRKDGQAVLRKRIREIAETRVRYGYRRIHVLLRREGWEINDKRIYRLYCEEGLQKRNKTPKRRVSAKLRDDRRPASAPGEVWAMDWNTVVLGVLSMDPSIVALVIILAAISTSFIYHRLETSLYVTCGILAVLSSIGLFGHVIFLLHVGKLSFEFAQALHHSAFVLVLNINGQFLVRLDFLTVFLLHDDLRRRYLEFIIFTPHFFNENGKVQLTSA